jgi:single-stranded-DNA-specific exonuclease
MSTAQTLSAPEWRLKKFDPEQLAPFEKWALPRPVVKALAHLGIESQDVDSFLNPSLDGWTRMSTFGSLQTGAPKVWELIQIRQPVCIHGDFDTDGLCASLILRRCLEVLGIEVFSYLPSREQGHGISVESLREVAARGARCVITVDCGISAADVALEAQKIDVAFVITDHHLPDSDLPCADVIINPQLDGHGHHRALCGAGVSFKLALELSQRAPQAKTRSAAFQEFLRHATVFAAIATVADVMPLIGDNRPLVAQGLKLLPEVTWPGLKCLIQELKFNANTHAEDLAFQLIPRLNSAQRLERGDMLRSLFECDNEAEAQTIVNELNELNVQRRSLQKQYSELALARVHPIDSEATLVWVSGDEWQEGFSGLIATRLVQTYGRPAAVVRHSEGKLQASCRAPEGYNLKVALDDITHLLDMYGGHAQAAGFKAPVENADSIRRELDRSLKEHSRRELGCPPLVILDEVPFGEINDGLLFELQRLEPFGQGNPKPLFATKGLMIDGNVRFIGVDKSHVGFRVFHAGLPSLEAIGFGLAEELKALDAFGKIDLIYHLGRSPYGGKLQLQVQALRQHRTPKLYN